MIKIKFRAWDVEGNRMVDLHKLTPLILNTETNGVFIPFLKKLIVEQFTGLKDKNGKEIYDGDYLEFLSCSGLDILLEEEPKLQTYMKPIFWNTDELCWAVGNTEDWFKPNIKTDNYEFLVVGNIHENPELTKKEEEK